MYESQHRWLIQVDKLIYSPFHFSSIEAFCKFSMLMCWFNLEFLFSSFAAVLRDLLLLGPQMISGLEILLRTRFISHRSLTTLYFLGNSCSQIGTCFM